ncbi:flagellar motor switch protein FliM [Bacillus sp. B-jedd]|uniref:flagellar motor switch protein FliM n=1 Tax=Bacillus sp. B-jedd TaxID=1476857 RepID=UPI0005155AA5|nr:flagellar motor switch protein FliM [Bacillus sp. B-jedd]CEG25885.1 flagellar motor switch protein FliM [Bacillus sp. B-jedd]
MAEVLSQQEIDALLSALHSGEIQASDVAENKDKVKIYDFKRAMRYSKDQLRSILRIHENFSRMLTSYFSAQLRTYVQIETDLVDQVNYQEFIASIPSKTIINIFDVNPMDGKMVIEVNPQVANAILERLMGGFGAQSQRSEALTEIETVLLKKIFTRTADMYQDVWKSIENIQVNLEGIESNPQFIQIASQNDTVIIIALRATIGDITGRMTICLPHLILEPVLPKLSTHQLLSTMAKKRPPQTEKIKQNLKNVNVPVIAEIGHATLSVADLMNLQNGDVIGIETGKLLVKIGDNARYLGNPGVQKGKYAVQIDQVVFAEGDEELNG